MVAGGQLDSRHLSNTQGNGLALGGHEHDFLTDFNASLCEHVSKNSTHIGIGIPTESKQARDHQLSTIADGINGAVLDDNALVGGQQALQRTNDLAKIRLIPLVIHQPLRVKNIMQSDHVVLLIHSPAANTAEFLHVRTDSKEQTQVHAEGTNVGTRLAANPEHTEMSVVIKLQQLTLVDCSDTQLALDGGDERRTLEERAGQSLQRASELGLSARDLVMQADDAHVLLSSTLLRLDQARSAINADNQTTRDFRIEGAAVSGLFDSTSKVSTR